MNLPVLYDFNVKNRHVERDVWQPALWKWYQTVTVHRKIEFTAASMQARVRDRSTPSEDQRPGNLPAPVLNGKGVCRFQCRKHFDLP